MGARRWFQSCKQLVGSNLGAYHSMRKTKIFSWHKVTFKLGMQDVWNVDSFNKLLNKNFTFYNGRLATQSMFSKINWLCVYERVDKRRAKVETIVSLRNASNQLS